MGTDSQPSLLSSYRARMSKSMELKRKRQGLLCLEGIMQVVDTFRVLRLSIRFILCVPFAHRSELKFHSLEYKNFTAGTHPPSLPAVPHSKSQTHPCVSHSDILQCYSVAWIHVISSAWGAHPCQCHQENSKPSLEFNASETLVEFPATDRFSKLLYTPIPMQVHFLTFIKLCYGHNLVLCLPLYPVDFLNVDLYFIGLLSIECCIKSRSINACVEWVIVLRLINYDKKRLLALVIHILLFSVMHSFLWDILTPVEMNTCK